MNYEENLTYDWLKEIRLKKLNEAKVRDFVSGRSAVSAQAAGVLDTEFTSAHDDFVELDPSWVSSNITTVTLINNKKVQFHVKYADMLKTAFEKACRSTGWTPENPNTGYCPKPNGGYVPRRSRAPGDSKIPIEKREIGSHAWGMSIDLGTAQENPMGGGGEIRKFPSFINEMQHGGFIWGGTYKTPDDMHFEVNVNGPIPPDIGGGLTGQTEFGSDAGGGDAMSSATYGQYWRKQFSDLISQASGDATIEKPKLTENQENSKKIFIIRNSSSNEMLQNNINLLKSMLTYYNKRLKLTKPVKITFVEDEKNSKNPLGRTAFYNPDKMSITIFTTNRFIKDILRSLGHELIHHKQHCIEEFEGMATPEGYAQKNKKLRKKEEEAYLFGNMLFRDWEDKYKTKHKKEL